jgi:hypothetical protein
MVERDSKFFSHLLVYKQIATLFGSGYCETISLAGVSAMVICVSLFGYVNIDKTKKN